MRFEWDDDKNIHNKAKHGLGFEALNDFGWAMSCGLDRTRPTDGEARYAAVGMLSGKLHTVIYTWRGDVRRIISLRRANIVEERAYEQTIRKK